MSGGAPGWPKSPSAPVSRGWTTPDLAEVAPRPRTATVRATACIQGSSMARIHPLPRGLRNAPLDDLPALVRMV